MSLQWIILIYKLPNLPERIKVGVWRRIKALGAIFLQKSVIILPNTPYLKSEMENLAHDIENFGGEVFYILSDQIEKENQIIEEFKNSVSKEYSKVSKNIEMVTKQILEKKTGINFVEIEKTIKGVRSSFSRIKRQDFFNTDDKIVTEKLLIECEAELYKLITNTEK